MMFERKKNKFIKPPGLTDTPFPVKGPGLYGQDYLRKFNDFLNGAVSMNEIIDYKNILTTRKNAKFQSKGKLFYGVQRRQAVRGNLQDLRHVFSSAGLKADVSRNIRTETKEPTIQIPQIKKIETDPNYESKSQALLRFEKIKQVIDRRVERKQFLKQQAGQSMANKILASFQQVADDYKNKIQNNDLISSNPQRQYYDELYPKIHTKNKSFSIIRLIKTKEYKMDSPNKMNPISIQTQDTFRDLSNQYIYSIQNTKNQISNSLVKKEINIKSQKAKSQSELLFNQRLIEYFSMRDQEKEIEDQIKIKNIFLSQIEEIDKADLNENNVQFNKVQSLKNLYDEKTNKTSSFSSTLSISQRNPNIHRKRQTYGPCVWNQRIKQIQTQKAIEEDLNSDDASLISNTEANLDKLYRQSKQIQNKVLNVNEKLDKQMKNFLKLEKIKEKINKISLTKIQ